MSDFKPHPELNLPECMTEGEKFIKWDEDNVGVTPVTLKVDKYGFYLHWIDQNSEAEVLDLAMLRDTRNGKYAKIPKDSKQRRMIDISSIDSPLEENTVTLVFGTDFVNLTFINFSCAKKEVAKLWADELMKLICNRALANASALTYLLKAYTKLTLLPDRFGKLPVENVLKMFSQNKEEEKRIENALDASGLPSRKNEYLDPDVFTFEDFLKFYKNLTQRSELEKIFDCLCKDTNSGRKSMSIEEFSKFINKNQRDPRLDEIQCPHVGASRAKDLITAYEPDSGNAERGLLSIDGFLRYLMSDDNPIVDGSKLKLSEDMDQPLAHYFINSSHNTYLSGHQVSGKSSVEMYRQCLVAGCRCVELDFWNGMMGEPIIKHGYTLALGVYARQVLEAIAESAFKTSDYPVILSFENHCNPRQQAKIAQYCREIFGEMLLDAPLETHMLEPLQSLPPPSMLKRKIIIKNKKSHHHHGSANAAPPPAVITIESETSAVTANESPTNSSDDAEAKRRPPLSRQSSKDSSQENDEDDDDSTDEIEANTEAEEIEGQMPVKPIKKVSTRKKREVGVEISALVNYVQPVTFVSFEVAEKRGRFYEMSSFNEKLALTLLKERPVEFLRYNKNQLSRVYPAGNRFDSSNFLPQAFWIVGCQLVAMNYQTLDLPMQLNIGIFEYNGGSGYRLKPESLRRHDCYLDPFTESTIDGIIDNTVSIQVISGQFLSDKRVGTYVEVEIYGLPADTVRKKYRTKIVPSNGINPVYDDKPFRFNKIILPELASIRVAAYEDTRKMIGHRFLPVVGLCPGFHHLGLCNESGQSLPLATLFLKVVVETDAPAGSPRPSNGSLVNAEPRVSRVQLDESVNDSLDSESFEHEIFLKEITVRKYDTLFHIILMSSSTKMKNALNIDILRELICVLNELKNDDSCRTVLVTSTGSLFCQGIDLPTLICDSKMERIKIVNEFVDTLMSFTKCLSQFPKILIAGVQGSAVGLGVTMLPFFDMVYASDKATFYTPYVKLGQIPEAGATLTLPRFLGNAITSELLLGCRMLNASEALQFGLVTRIMWPDKFTEVLLPLARNVASHSLEAMEATKSLLRQGMTANLEEQIKKEAKLLRKCWYSDKCQSSFKTYLDQEALLQNK